MSSQIIASELLFTLSNQQQEVISGGADFELSGSNYTNRLANLQGVTASGPGGSTGTSIGTSSALNTAAQNLLGLGATAVPTVSALGPAQELGLSQGNTPSNNAIGGQIIQVPPVNPAG